jgi:transposase
VTPRIICNGATQIQARSGRDFSTWVGLVSKQSSSGGKDKLGGISNQGDRYLRSLFTAGTLAVIRYAKIHGTDRRPRRRWGHHQQAAAPARETAPRAPEP